MTGCERIAEALAMDQATWDRHTNLRSCWAGVAVLPAACLAIWARDRAGAWCPLTITLLIVWTWWHPRAFAPRASTRASASEAVLGDRVKLRHGRGTIPGQRASMARFRSLRAGIGAPPLVRAPYADALGARRLGLARTMGPTMWFLDRLVGLFRHIAARHPAYTAWSR